MMAHVFKSLVAGPSSGLGLGLGSGHAVVARRAYQACSALQARL